MPRLACLLSFFAALFVLFSSTQGRAGEVCFPFGHVTEDDDQTRPLPAQGRPGKSGAVGHPGPQGVAGPPGQCACDPNEIEQLNGRIQNLQDALEVIERSVISLEEARVSYCNVGMEDGRILDSQLSASRSHHSNYVPRYGRLNNQPSSGSSGCWIGVLSSRANPGEYIQIALSKPTRVTGVITQGRPNVNQYTTGYNIAYGNSTDSMQTIKDSSSNDKIFPGNNDDNTPVTNIFLQPITANYFQLIVQTWHSYPAIRMELLTC